VSMQGLILNPLSPAKNPIIFNIASWSLRFMNYSKSMSPRSK
jgi:hypothetical protein